MTWTAAKRVPLILTAVPLIYLVWMCVRLHVDVPFWDQWELVPKLERLDRGALSVRDLWAQHNEHRPMFPIILMLTLAWISDWNIGFEIAANLALGLGIFAVYLAYVRAAWDTHGGTPRWLLPIVSTLVFSPAQWENWLWGWQIQVLMGVVASLGGLWLLSAERTGTWRFGAAVACGVVATYSFAAGLVYWAAGLLVMGLTGGTGRHRRTVVWLVVAAATLASYFYDYHMPAGRRSIGSTVTSVDALGQVGLYVLKYLGSPLAGSIGPAAVAFGAAVLLLYVYLVGRFWSVRHDPAVIFPAVVGLQTVAVACMSALGRAALGGNQAMAPRYITISTSLWVAVVILSALAVRRTWPSGRRGTAARVLPVAAALVVLAASLASSYHGQAYATARSDRLRQARRALIAGNNEALMSRLYPVPAVLKQRRAILRMLAMSVFREP